MARAAATKKKATTWTLDWNVPVSLIFTIAFGLLGQAVVALNWADKIEFRVTNVEKSVTDMQPQGDRLTRVEAKLDALTQNVGDIKSVLLSLSPKSTR